MHSCCLPGVHVPLLFTPLNVPGAVYPSGVPTECSWAEYCVSCAPAGCPAWTQRCGVLAVDVPALGREASAGVSAGGGRNLERADFAPVASAPSGRVGSAQIPGEPGLSSSFLSSTSAELVAPGHEEHQQGGTGCLSPLRSLRLVLPPTCEAL